MLFSLDTPGGIHLLFLSSLLSGPDNFLCPLVRSLLSPFCCHIAFSSGVSPLRFPDNNRWNSCWTLQDNLEYSNLPMASASCVLTDIYRDEEENMCSLEFISWCTTMTITDFSNAKTLIKWGSIFIWIQRTTIEISCIFNIKIWSLSVFTPQEKCNSWSIWKLDCQAWLERGWPMDHLK